jgi:hypothetical protein
MNCLIDPCVLLAADSRCLLDLNEDAERVLLDLLVTSYFTCALSRTSAMGFGVAFSITGIMATVQSSFAWLLCEKKNSVQEG